MNKLLDLKRHVLENGLEVVTVKKESQLMSINLGIKIGSIYEEDNEKGLSHYIEHMIFKGTKKRNNNDLMHDIEELGGEVDAFTDNTSTVFSVSALSSELENSLEILSDMIINSQFKKKEIQKERGVILSEIKSSYDDIEDYSYRIVNEIAFEGNNLMYDVLGTEECVKNFKRDDLLRFYNKYYVPNNSCLIIVSPNDHSYVLNIVNDLFEKWEKRDFIKKKFEPMKNKPKNNTVYRKDIEQSTILYLFSNKGLTRKEEIALDVLNYKMGDNSNSILFKELREEKGLCYEVYSSISEIDDFKILYIYTSVNSSDVDETIEAIDNCIEDILNESIHIDGTLFKLIKKVFKTDLASTFETCSNIGDFILQYVLREKDINDVIKYMENLEQMKVEEIYDIAKKFLKNYTRNILIGKE